MTHLPVGAAQGTHGRRAGRQLARQLPTPTAFDPSVVDTLDGPPATATFLDTLSGPPVGPVTVVSGPPPPPTDEPPVGPVETTARNSKGTPEPTPELTDELPVTEPQRQTTTPDVTPDPTPNFQTTASSPEFTPDPTDTTTRRPDFTPEPPVETTTRPFSTPEPPVGGTTTPVFTPGPTDATTTPVFTPNSTDSATEGSSSRTDGSTEVSQPSQTSTGTGDSAPSPTFTGTVPTTPGPPTTQNIPNPTNTSTGTTTPEPPTNVESATPTTPIATPLETTTFTPDTPTPTPLDSTSPQPQPTPTQGGTSLSSADFPAVSLTDSPLVVSSTDSTLVVNPETFTSQPTAGTEPTTTAVTPDTTPLMSRTSLPPEVIRTPSETPTASTTQGTTNAPQASATNTPTAGATQSRSTTQGGTTQGGTTQGGTTQGGASTTLASTTSPLLRATTQLSNTAADLPVVTSISQTGNFTLKARPSLQKQENALSATKFITTTATVTNNINTTETAHSGALTAGVIAGIAIGSTALFLVLLVILLLLLRWRKKRNKPDIYTRYPDRRFYGWESSEPLRSIDGGPRNPSAFGFETVSSLPSGLIAPAPRISGNPWSGFTKQSPWRQSGRSAVYSGALEVGSISNTSNDNSNSMLLTPYTTPMPSWYGEPITPPIVTRDVTRQGSPASSIGTTFVGSVGPSSGHGHQHTRTMSSGSYHHSRVHSSGTAGFQNARSSGEEASQDQEEGLRSAVQSSEALTTPLRGTMSAYVPEPLRLPTHTASLNLAHLPRHAQPSLADLTPVPPAATRESRPRAATLGSGQPRLNTNTNMGMHASGSQTHFQYNDYGVSHPPTSPRKGPRVPVPGEPRAPNNNSTNTLTPIVEHDRDVGRMRVLLPPVYDPSWTLQTSEDGSSIRGRESFEGRRPVDFSVPPVPPIPAQYRNSGRASRTVDPAEYERQANIFSHYFPPEMSAAEIEERIARTW